MQSAVRFNQNGEEHTKIRFWAACVVACRSAISKICTLMQACSTSYLNDGITCPCSLNEWDKLEAVNKGVVNDVIKWQKICCSGDQYWDQNPSQVLLRFSHPGQTQKDGTTNRTSCESDNLTEPCSSRINSTSAKCEPSFLKECCRALLYHRWYIQSNQCQICTVI